MRRNDREVTKIEDLLSIVEECKVCYVGFSDEEGMFIMALNFGYEYIDGKIALYVHSAKEGRKISAIKKNSRVCIEMDCMNELKTGTIACEYGYRFKSIMGNGHAVIVEDVEEKKKGLSILMKHQTDKVFEFDEKMTECVDVIRIDLDEFTGKYHK